MCKVPTFVYYKNLTAHICIRNFDRFLLSTCTHTHRALKEPRLHYNSAILVILTFDFYLSVNKHKPNMYVKSLEKPTWSRTITSSRFVFILFLKYFYYYFLLLTSSATLLPRSNVFSVLTVLPEPRTTLPAVFWLYGFTCAPLYQYLYARCVRYPPPFTLVLYSCSDTRSTCIEDKKKISIANNTIIYFIFPADHFFIVQVLIVFIRKYTKWENLKNVYAFYVLRCA